MGKPKVRGSRGARKTGGGKKARPAQASYSIEDLLGKASELLEECQFDAAEKFCQRALELDQDNVVALEMLKAKLPQGMFLFVKYREERLIM